MAAEVAAAAPAVVAVAARSLAAAAARAVVAGSAVSVLARSVHARSVARVAPVAANPGDRAACAKSHDLTASPRTLLLGLRLQKLLSGN